MSRIAFVASAASSCEPWVGMTTRSARLIAYATIIEAVPSRSTMTKGVFCDALSLSSMIVASPISAMTVMFSGRPALFAHWETGLFGSASMIVTCAPLSASSVARITADVDLPAPPLGLSANMFGLGGFLLGWRPGTTRKATRYQNGSGYLFGSQRLAVGYPKAF